MAHLRQMRRFIAASLFFGAAVPGYSGTVTNTQDSGAGSLRDAINAFNAGGPSGSSIIFSIPATDPGCTSADHCTINVASPLVVTGHGDLQIGGSAQHIVLSWSGSAGMGAMLSPTSSVRLTLESLTLENASGGAIHVTGSVYIWNSTFVNNSACSGGAIYLEDFGFLYMVNDTFAGNVASGTGSCAHPGSGGALFVNQGQGQTTVFVAHATFADNFAASGGAVLGASSYGSGLHVDFLNSILAKSVGGNCAAGVRLDGAGGSLDDDGSCAFNPSGNVVAADPLLGPLQDNGGPTPTMALKSGSPAIDAASDTLDEHLPYGVLTYDQRGSGFPRKVGLHADIGAYEVQPAHIKPVLCLPSACRPVPVSMPTVPCLLDSANCLPVPVACCGPVSPESVVAVQPSVIAPYVEAAAVTRSTAR